jgi:hypothetical protein
MKRFAAGLISALALTMFATFPARAISTSSDHSGLWWNASENGWGMNVIQQEQILFVTLFVYGPNGPTWFVASNAAFVSANAAGDRTYTGDLYRTAGTPFGVSPYNPGAVTVETVGTITFVGLADGTATVRYNVNANTVNKTVTRQTWARPEFALSTATPYVGASSDVTTGCANAGNNGRGSSTYSQIALYINSVGNTMRLEITTDDAGVCILQGNNYVQEGRYGKATLTGSCSAFPANPINFRAREVEIGADYFTLRQTVTGGPDSVGCTSTGVMMGAKK